jgi:hypothetical protein
MSFTTTPAPLQLKILVAPPGTVTLVLNAQRDGTSMLRVYAPLSVISAILGMKTPVLVSHATMATFCPLVLVSSTPTLKLEPKTPIAPHGSTMHVLPALLVPTSMLMVPALL